MDQRGGVDENGIGDDRHKSGALALVARPCCVVLGSVCLRPCIEPMSPDYVFMNSSGKCKTRDWYLQTWAARPARRSWRAKDPGGEPNPAKVQSPRRA